MENQSIITIRFLVATILLFNLNLTAHAETIEIKHLNPPAKLDLPGKTMQLEFKINSTEQNTYYLVGQIDNRSLMLSANSESSKTQQGLVSFLVPTPILSIDYFLVVNQKGNIIANSDNYSFQRDCFPDLELNLENDDSKNAKELVLELKQLKNELNNYEAVLDSIQKLIQLRP